MKSATPKVLHEIAGRSLLGHVLAAVSEINPAQLCVVVGAGREAVQSHLANIAPSAKTVFQDRRGGTGHATQLALAELKVSGTVIVLAGDTPMLTGAAIKELIAVHKSSGATASVMTAEHPDPSGYGRIIRGDDGTLLRIVEEKDADEDQKMIFEINSGVYAFDGAKLTAAIGKLSTANAQGELYLTDVIEILRNEGGSISAVLIEDYVETLGVNDRYQLAESAAYLRDRINETHMENGVTIVDPPTTWIDVNVAIASDVTIYPGSSLQGATTIESGAIIGPRTSLTNCQVGQNATVIESNCTDSQIGSSANVGPFTYLRAGTVLKAESKAGAFVEIKNSQVGVGSKVPHLSYVGDATIGEGTNIGAATIFVNYDGVEKHQTIIGDHVRIGSDTMLVAPVNIGDGAYTAAGSVITQDVPSGAIGVGRATQKNVLGWVMRKRAGSKSALAAEAKVKKG